MPCDTRGNSTSSRQLPSHCRGSQAVRLLDAADLDLACWPVLRVGRDSVSLCTGARLQSCIRRGWTDRPLWNSTAGRTARA